MLQAVPDAFRLGVRKARKIQTRPPGETGIARTLPDFSPRA